MDQISFSWPKEESFGQKRGVLAETICFGQNYVYRPNNRYSAKTWFMKSQLFVFGVSVLKLYRSTAIWNYFPGSSDGNVTRLKRWRANGARQPCVLLCWRCWFFAKPAGDRFGDYLLVICASSPQVGGCNQSTDSPKEMRKYRSLFLCGMRH